MQPHVDLVGAAHHVVVGEHVDRVALPLHQDPRAQARLAELPLLALAVLRVAEEEVPGGLEARPALGDHLLGVDLHDHGQHRLGHPAEGILDLLQALGHLHGLPDRQGGGRFALPDAEGRGAGREVQGAQTQRRRRGELVPGHKTS